MELGFSKGATVINYFPAATVLPVRLSFLPPMKETENVHKCSRGNRENIVHRPDVDQAITGSGSSRYPAGKRGPEDANWNLQACRCQSSGANGPLLHSRVAGNTAGTGTEFLRVLQRMQTFGWIFFLIFRG